MCLEVKKKKIANFKIAMSSQRKTVILSWVRLGGMMQVKIRRRKSMIRLDSIPLGSQPQ